MSRDPTPEEMRDVRVSILVSMCDEPDLPWTAEMFVSYWKDSGEYTELRWIEEALHQLLWAEVLTKPTPKTYSRGEKFDQYRIEMEKYTEQHLTNHGDLHGGREDTRQDS